MHWPRPKGGDGGGGSAGPRGQWHLRVRYVVIEDSDDDCDDAEGKGGDGHEQQRHSVAGAVLLLQQGT